MSHLWEKNILNGNLNKDTLLLQVFTTIRPTGIVWDFYQANQ